MRAVLSYVISEYSKKELVNGVCAEAMQAESDSNDTLYKIEEENLVLKAFDQNNHRHLAHVRHPPQHFTIGNSSANRNVSIAL